MNGIKKLTMAICGCDDALGAFRRFARNLPVLSIGLGMLIRPTNPVRLNETGSRQTTTTSTYTQGKIRINTNEYAVFAP